MKEYMKMSDFISGLVSNHDGELLDDRGFVAACDGSTSGKGDCIAHAINSHDELVAEVELLRGQLACAFMAGWEEGVNGMECDEAEVASVEIAEQFARN